MIDHTPDRGRLVCDDCEMPVNTIIRYRGRLICYNCRFTRFDIKRRSKISLLPESQQDLAFLFDETIPPRNFS